MILTCSRPGAPRVVLLAPGVATDSDGDPVDSWDPADVTRTPLPGAEVQERTGTETLDDGRARVVSSRVLYAPGRPPITPASRVEVDGEVFQVVGDPVYRRSLGTRGFTTAALSRATG